jgi:hypothetical protein
MLGVDLREARAAVDCGGPSEIPTRVVPIPPHALATGSISCRMSARSDLEREENPVGWVWFKSGGIITTRKHPVQDRTVKAFNPVARPGYQFFVALMSGERAVHGFASHDLRAKLMVLIDQLRDDPKQHTAQINRVLHRLHVYGLVAKIPRSRRWCVTAFGHRVMDASVVYGEAV